MQIEISTGTATRMSPTSHGQGEKKDWVLSRLTTSGQARVRNDQQIEKACMVPPCTIGAGLGSANWMPSNAEGTKKPRFKFSTSGDANFGTAFNSIRCNLESGQQGC